VHAIPATPKAMMKACECHRAKGLKLNAKNVAINAGIAPAAVELGKEALATLSR
jgi:hypothetical protein